MKGLQTLKRILEEYMSLENSVIIYDNTDMPANDNIHILLKILSSQISAHECKITIDGSKDIFTVKYGVSAEMVGKPTDVNYDPRERHIEMAMALKSYTCTQLIEQNGVSIQTLGECQNVSKIEEAGVLCRFKQDFTITEDVEKSSNVGYFDKLGKLTTEVQQ